VRPLVSVCIPAYNTASLLGHAIESVLGQTLPDFELIVVDDCSTDDTAAVARRYRDPRVRVLVNTQNLGAPANWDRTVREASGKYVKLLHGDDVLYATCLEKQVRVLEDNAKVVLAASRRDIIDCTGRLLLHGRGLTGLEGIVDGPTAIRGAVRCGTNPFGEPCAVLARADTLRLVGDFRSAAGYVVDLDMWCRLLGLGDLYADRSVLSAFRVHPGSWSAALSRLQSQQAQTLWFELWRDDPELIAGRDVLRGAVKAWSFGLARRAGYWSLSDRAQAKGRTVAGAAVGPVGPG
jgi:glycosyltransferase involved in cell wall biosynthesis